MMRDFGYLENRDTHVKKDMVVTWKDADLFKELKLAGLVGLTGLLIYKTIITAFETGAEAYDTAEYNNLYELGLIKDCDRKIDYAKIDK